VSNHTVCWVDVPVVDLDRAIRFYSAVLGAEVRKESAGPGVEFGLLPHFDDNVAGCLAAMPDGRPSEHGPLVYFNVNGRLDDALRAARDAGARIVREKHPIGPHGYRAVLIDSEGNRIALHSQTA